MYPPPEAFPVMKVLSFFKCFIDNFWKRARAVKWSQVDYTHATVE